MKPITDFELKFMNIFADSGVQMLPNSDRSAYNSDQDYEFAMFVHNRLGKFYALYKPESQSEEASKDW
jgi:hypothetical protein